MSVDPYSYPGTDVLINKENIRDADELRRFERMATGQRLMEGVPQVALTATGLRQLHQHLFQDVFAWAGQYRTVDIEKGGSFFCKADYIKTQLDKRFQAIAADGGWMNATPAAFAARAGDHLAEINAIHPFREGNGRALRALLVVLARHAGLDIDLRRIDPPQWNEASRISFLSGDAAPMVAVIAKAIIRKQPPPNPAKRSPPTPKFGA